MPQPFAPSMPPNIFIASCMLAARNITQPMMTSSIVRATRTACGRREGPKRLSR